MSGTLDFDPRKEFRSFTILPGVKKKRPSKAPNNTYLSNCSRTRGAEKHARPTWVPDQPFLTQKHVYLLLILKEWSKSNKIAVQIFVSKTRSVTAKTDKHWEQRQERFFGVSKKSHEARPSLEEGHE